MFSPDAIMRCNATIRGFPFLYGHVALLHIRRHGSKQSLNATRSAGGMVRHHDCSRLWRGLEQTASSVKARLNR